MCFHVSLNKKPVEIAARYGRRWNLLTDFEPVCHVSAFNFPMLPIVTTDGEIQFYRWGLIPFWTDCQADASELRLVTLNARAETLYEKPAFCRPAARSRCLVPSTGWFEWLPGDGTKEPYFVKPADGEIFSLAGIYDTWTNPGSGERLHTFSLITLPDKQEGTGAGRSRQPAVVHPFMEERWLSPELSREQVAAILDLPPHTAFTSYPLDKDFMKKEPFDETILTPA